ncbi:glycosyltransferase family 2 protein [Bacillus salitolerans]|uniref:Glycosyltransferase family 2 protein n=1 Tax=Bacillus salitolerans TaxID=1437434 RepID=A0ABW4LJS1_9BACI
MISVIACTNRPSFLNNLLKSYARQTMKEKELIIILHNINSQEDLKKLIYSHDKSIKVLELDDTFSLGECLNHGIQVANYTYIAKFDDDDYYGPKYLECSFRDLNYSRADITGKTTTFMYFQKEQVLGLYLPYNENQITNTQRQTSKKVVFGGTLLFKKEIVDNVPFQDRDNGVDTFFCLNSIEYGYRIYSNSRYHYAYFRYGDQHHHTSKGYDSRLMRNCIFIDRVEDFQKYIECNE